MKDNRLAGGGGQGGEKAWVECGAGEESILMATQTFSSHILTVFDR